MKQFCVEIRGGVECIVRKNALAKQVSLKVNTHGQVRATIPWWVSKKSAISFVKDNESWILEKLENMKGKSAESLLQLGGREDYLMHRKSAKSFILERLEHYNQFYGFDFERVAIRDQRTRWGSCSGKKNLNFNYRIVQLPKEHADYLIVHELCHLEQMNHSRDFWELVSRTIPDYRRISRELRRM